MKKLFSLFLLSLFTISAHANVLFVEEFNYTSGTALGTVGGWTTTGDLTDGEGRIVNDLTLSYTDAAGEYILSGSKSLKHNYASNKTGDATSEQYVSYNDFAKVESGAVYLTYLFKADGAQKQSNGELLGLTSGSSNPSARPWIGKTASDATGNTFRFGLTMHSGSSGDVVWGETAYSIEDVILLVLKYDLDNKAASLFINPALGTTEEPTADLVDNKGTVRTNINHVMFRNQGASKANYFVGGVRVSTTWAEAVAIKPQEEGIERIVTNFNDGTWGEVVEKYEKDNYPSTSINAFQLNAAGIISGSISYNEEKFTNRIAIDKGGMVTLPALKTADSIIIYASSGTEQKQLALQKYNYKKSEWETIGTYTFDAKATCYPFKTVLNSKELTRLRIVNMDGSTKYIWKIQTCPCPPAIEQVRFSLNFGESKWTGKDLTTATIEDANFAQCTHNTGSYYLSSGRKIEGRVELAGNSGIMELPAVISMARLDIYAAAGTVGKKMKVQQYNYGLLEWQDISTIQLSKDYTRHTIMVNSASATRLRIVNIDNSKKYILKIVSYPTLPTDLTFPTSLEATSIGAHAFTAKWNTVPNANGYRVVVYDSTEKRITTEEVNDGNVFQYNITDLDANTNYSFRVAAVGDDETSIDSDLSAAVMFTTANEITDTYTREVTNGNYGTICLPYGCDDISSVGAIFFSVAGKVMDGSKLKEIVLNEVSSLEAGKPYIFYATSDKLNIPLSGEQATEAKSENGLIGCFVVTKLSNSVNYFILKDNKLYCAKGHTYYAGENRAYVRIDEMSEFDGSAAAPGKRQVRMAVEQEQTATGMEDVVMQGSNGKIIRDGQLYIYRDGQMYDVMGRMVK